ncbi:glycosyltransferase family 2 protein [Bacillaceae bacterium SIJ1]|uniref:tetratricopeptide repeat-containing glycosyltransferase family 2 protein n=1 Tax=Litoribacterium kuwaitense TaxID=1398745 RepID=UPI0013E9A462|nr:glycosyltransferase family 2 protein [Litoribacterium kuwaitense]NGP43865.1 glycosyltransferase family 2 protein [Litoribacterium kuwaitense]
MIEISLCMIVKNEEEVLGDCLESVKGIADEINILDTGSTDRTKEVAARFTDRIYDFEWVDHFAKARNAAFAKATKPYILWLDADDLLLEKDRVKLLALKKQLAPEVDAVSMFYHTMFDENGNVSFEYRRNRLVKRENGFRWHGAVHEYLAVGGHIVESDIAITHQKNKKTNQLPKDRNLKIYERMLEKNEEMTPRDLYYFANELKDHQQAERSNQFYEKFLQTKNGWVEDKIRACLCMSDNYKQQGDKEAALHAVLRSFSYEIPRPQHSCEVGDYFIEREQFDIAAFWYRHALSYEGKELPGFNMLAFSSWYPALQLVVCYWRLNDLKMAKKYHKISKKYQPTHPSVLHNESFLKGN